MMPKIFWIVIALMAIFSPGCALGENIVRLRDNVVVEAGRQVDSAIAIGGNVRVDGVVRKDVVALGGSVFLGPEAVVRGNVVSFGGAVTQQEGAQIGGETTILNAPGVASFFHPDGNERWYWPYEFLSIPGFVPFLGFLALTLLMVVLAPGVVGHISGAIEQGPVSSFFWGILGMASIFPIAFMLIISIIGILLIPFQMLLVGIGMFLGYVSVVQLMGRKIFNAARMHDKPMIVETLLGMIVFWLVSQAPFVGWLFVTIAMVMGFGGVISVLFKSILRGRSTDDRVVQE